MKFYEIPIKSAELETYLYNRRKERGRGFKNREVNGIIYRALKYKKLKNEGWADIPFEKIRKPAENDSDDRFFKISDHYVRDIPGKRIDKRYIYNIVHYEVSEVINAIAATCKMDVEEGLTPNASLQLFVDFLYSHIISCQWGDNEFPCTEPIFQFFAEEGSSYKLNLETAISKIAEIYSKTEQNIIEPLLFSRLFLSEVLYLLSIDIINGKVSGLNMANAREKMDIFLKNFSNGIDNDNESYKSRLRDYHSSIVNEIELWLNFANIIELLKENTIKDISTNYPELKENDSKIKIDDLYWFETEAIKKINNLRFDDIEDIEQLMIIITSAISKSTDGIFHEFIFNYNSNNSNEKELIAERNISRYYQDEDIVMPIKFRIYIDKDKDKDEDNKFAVNVEYAKVRRAYSHMRTIRTNANEAEPSLSQEGELIWIKEKLLI